MRRYKMMHSYPIGAGPIDFSYFIDGKRVIASEYHKMIEQAKQHDTFHSSVKGDRIYHRSVIRI